MCNDGGNECENGGTCLTATIPYNCKCATGYTGDTCQFITTSHSKESLMAFITDGGNAFATSFIGDAVGWVQILSRPRQNLTSWGPTAFTVPNSLRTTRGIENKTVLVKTSDNVRTVGIYGAGAYTPLPISGLGSRYIVSSCHPPGDYTSVLVIATHRQKTNVDITFRTQGTVNYGGRTYRNGDTLTMYLDEFQTLTIRSNFDLMGTIVNSRETVALFIGTVFNNRVVAYDQLLPVRHYGTEYVVAVDDHPISYQLQIVSNHSDTRIIFSNGTAVSVGNIGLYLQILTQNASFQFVSSRPVMTTLCAKEQLRSGFTIVPPVSLYIKHTVFNKWGVFRLLTKNDANDVVVRTNTEPNIPVERKNIQGTQYKVGTWRISQYPYTSVTSSTAFTILDFYSVQMYNMGYNIVNTSETSVEPRTTTAATSIEAKPSVVLITGAAAGGFLAIFIFIIVCIVLLDRWRSKWILKRKQQLTYEVPSRGTEESGYEIMKSREQDDKKTNSAYIGDGYLNPILVTDSASRDDGSVYAEISI